MNQSQSETFAAARKLDDWTGLPDADQAAGLLRAADYITQTYRLRAIDGAADQALYDQAQFLIAYDIILNDTALPTRETQAITESTLEGAGVGKESIKYSGAPADPYPRATSVLRPLRCDSYSGIAFGLVVN